jgi:hypothetical protein
LCVSRHFLEAFSMLQVLPLILSVSFITNFSNYRL